MDDDTSIEQMHYQQLLLRERLERTYNEIYMQCYGQMKREAADGKNSFTFSVPTICEMEPKYNIIDCIHFMIVKLKKNSYLVRYIAPAYIYISWKYSAKQANLKKKADFLFVEDMKSRIIYESSGSLEMTQKEIHRPSIKRIKSAPVIKSITYNPQ